MLYFHYFHIFPLFHINRQFQYDHLTINIILYKFGINSIPIPIIKIMLIYSPIFSSVCCFIERPWNQGILVCGKDFNPFDCSIYIFYIRFSSHISHDKTMAVFVYILYFYILLDFKQLVFISNLLFYIYLIITFHLIVIGSYFIVTPTLKERNNNNNNNNKGPWRGIEQLW